MAKRNFPDFCADLLLGHNVPGLHEKVEVTFNGRRPSLSLWELTSIGVTEPQHYVHLSECRPIATKHNSHSEEGEHFVSSEVQRLVKDGLVKPSTSQWRVQALVKTNSKYERRAIVDWSNWFVSHTDAYPPPRIDTVLSNTASLVHSTCSDYY